MVGAIGCPVGSGLWVLGHPVLACACQQRGPSHRRPDTPSAGDTSYNLPAVPAAAGTPRQPEGTWRSCHSSVFFV